MVAEQQRKRRAEKRAQQMKTRMTKIRLVAGVLLAILMLFAGSIRAIAAGEARPEFASTDELAGKRIGNLTGSMFIQYIDGHIVGHGEVLNYNSTAELAAALKAGKIDAFVVDEPTAALLVKRNEGITMMPEPLETTDYGFFFPKGSALVSKFDPVLERMWADGTMESLNQKWIVSGDEGEKTLPAQDWDAPNGTITMATSSLYEPMSYPAPDGTATGYDIELALLICRELGYRLELVNYSLDGIIMAVQAGKADFGGTGSTITEERKEMVDFSVPTYRGAVVVVVRDANYAGPSTDLLTGIGASFERTFITEDRWRMVASGLGVTLLITAAASALGTALGFALTLERRKSPIVDRIVSGFQTLMSGLPTVVVLMLLYYVLFGAVDVPGVLVAILGFALTFGSTASSNIWNAVRSVDEGQREAALALGYRESDSFKKVVLPQAATQFMPLLLGQLIGLVKETSIVGYIAVQDLTRASDLIRTRTMEAFFPLIATAVIYFAICWLLRRFGARLLESWEPTSRPRTIEGVNL